jgi:hypothetical protein
VKGFLLSFGFVSLLGFLLSKELKRDYQKKINNKTKEEDKRR